MSFANGVVPVSHLVEVEPGKLLEAATAAAYLEAKAESGGRLRIASPAGAYRSLAVQVDMHANPAKYGFDPKFSGKLAKPGASPHGLGTALDLTYSSRAWATLNLGRFGFKRPLVQDDPGHWVFKAPTYAPAALEEDDLTPEQASMLNNIYQGVWFGGGATIDGVSRTFKYGILPIVANNQALIAGLIATVDKLAVGHGLDPAAIQAAAKAGALEALASLKIPTAIENGQAARAAIVK